MTLYWHRFFSIRVSFRNMWIQSYLIQGLPDILVSKPDQTTGHSSTDRICHHRIRIYVVVFYLRLPHHGGCHFVWHFRMYYRDGCAYAGSSRWSPIQYASMYSFGYCYNICRAPTHSEDVLISVICLCLRCLIYLTLTDIKPSIPKKCTLIMSRMLGWGGNGFFVHGIEHLYSNWGTSMTINIAYGLAHTCHNKYILFNCNTRSMRSAP